MSSGLIDRKGSHAGRGFRYQDAVAAWRAVRVWAREDPSALVIPEGGDDVECRTGAEASLVQVKSRRAHLGPLNPAGVEKPLKELWERHDRATDTPSSLELIVEQGVARHAAGVDGRISLAESFAKRLTGTRRKRDLLVKTTIFHVPNPKEDAVALIARETNCSPIEAEICFVRLLEECGLLASDNGMRRPKEYRGLCASDIADLINGTLAITDPAFIEAAVRDGTCEAVDFRTPIADPGFYLGVDVQPGHVTAGLVLPRIGPRRSVIDGLDYHSAALVAGPSGSRALLQAVRRLVHQALSPHERQRGRALTA